MSAPRPRAANLGSASFVHIGRISRGGPGRATATRPSGRVASHPGAVPFGFARAIADGILHACFRFISGRAIPRRAQRSRSQASRSGSATSRLLPDVGDGFAGQVVRGRSEPTRGNDQVDRREGVAECRCDRLPIVGQCRDPGDPDTGPGQRTGQLAGVRVAGFADGDFRADAQEFGRAESSLRAIHHLPA